MELHDDNTRFGTAEHKQPALQHAPPNLGPALEPPNVPLRVADIHEQRAEMVVVVAAQRSAAQWQPPLEDV